MATVRNARSEFERAVRAMAQPRYALRLYIAGQTPYSVRAVRTLKALCDTVLAGRYDLEVIDIYQEPDRARADQIIALPTLVKYRPEPVRRLIGDLSDRKVVLRGLGLSRERTRTDDARPAPKKTRTQRRT